MLEYCQRRADNESVARRADPGTQARPWRVGGADTQSAVDAQYVCVLATTGAEGPIATPVRYFHLGFTIMFTASPRSPKMRNISDDPRVSIGIHAPLVGLAGSRGAQVFGSAVVIPSTDPDFNSYWEAFRWESEQIEQGRSPDDDPGGVVVVEAARVVYTEHWLRRDGFAPRQVWRRL